MKRARSCAFLLVVVSALRAQGDPVLVQARELAEGGRIEEAAEKLRTAVERKGASRERVESLVDLLWQMQETERSLEEARRWLGTYPASGRLHGFAGNALFLMRRFSEAEAQYREAAKIEGFADFARQELEQIARERSYAATARRLERRALWLTGGCGAALLLVLALALHPLAGRRHRSEDVQDS